MATVGMKLLVAGLGLALLTGCGQGRLGATTAPQPDRPTAAVPADSTSPEAEPTVAEKPTTPDGVLGKAERHKLTLETSDGYKEVATLTLYPGVSGRSGDHLAAGWAAVGGQGSQPCGSQMLHDYIQTAQLQQETTYYVFGTLSIKNESGEGFTPPQMTWQWTANGQQFAVFGAGYSNGSRCNGISGVKAAVTPQFTSDSWGPVPVVIGLPNVYTPKHPKGDASMIDSFGLGLFTLEGVATIDGKGEGAMVPPPIGMPGSSTVNW